MKELGVPMCHSRKAVGYVAKSEHGTEVWAGEKGVRISSPTNCSSEFEREDIKRTFG